MPAAAGTAELTLRQRIHALLQDTAPGGEPEFPYAASFTAQQIAALRSHFLPASLARAAVLVPLVERPEGLQVMLTLRASHMKNHGGQVSFPGGRVEPMDAGPWEAALRAVTLEPARAFGMDREYGSVAPGRVANLVVWSGDPFEIATRVQHVIVRGRTVSLRTRQSALLDRYRRLARPRR